MKLFYFLLLFVLMSIPIYSQKHRLNINFNGIAVDKGQLMIRIQNAEGETIERKIVALEDKTAFYNTVLPAGSYAVSAFHDKNSNKKLDKSILGLPKEKYGFSNNVRGSFGPPAIQDQLFELKEDMTISITLK